MNDQTDSDLLVKIAQHRSASAFTELFKRYQRLAFNLARQITSNQTLAEEAVQEGMLCVWTSAGTFRVEGNARGWILAIVVREAHRLCSKIGQEKNRIEIKSRNDSDRSASDVPSGNEELHAFIRKQITALPSQHRTMLTMYFGAGLSQQKIGETLSLPQRTVSHKIETALKALRSSLQQAGFTATVTILSPENLHTILCNGPDAPASLFQKVQTCISQQNTKPLKSANHNSTQSAFQPKVIALVAALGVTAFLLNALSHTESMKPIKPAISKPMGTIEGDGLFHKKWTFEDAPKMPFTILHGKWKKWIPASESKPAALQAYPDHARLIFFELPVELPQKPLKITLHVRIPNAGVQDFSASVFFGLHHNQTTLNGTSDQAVLEVFYGGQQSNGKYLGHWKIPGMRYFDRNQKVEPLVYYAVENVIAESHPNRIGRTVEEYASPYPSKKMVIALYGYALESIEIEEIDASERPDWLLDVPAFLKAFKVDGRNLTER